MIRVLGFVSLNPLCMVYGIIYACGTVPRRDNCVGDQVSRNSGVCSQPGRTVCELVVDEGPTGRVETLVIRWAEYWVPDQYALPIIMKWMITKAEALSTK